jgi:hypothetical protein
MQISSESSPMNFTLPDGKLQVLMPMFVQWKDDKPEPKPEPVIENIEYSEQATNDFINESGNDEIDGIGDDVPELEQVS